MRGGSLGIAFPLGLAWLATCVADAAAQRRPIAPRDVIERPAIAQVQLSPDGRRVAFVLRVRDVDTDSETRSSWLWTEGLGVDSLPIDSRASHLRWRPDGRAISYLAPDSAGVAQVWEVLLDQQPRKLTAQAAPVSSYEWAPDGRRMAITTTRRLHSDDLSEGAGVIIDNVRFFANRLFEKRPFVQADSHYGDPPTRTELWVADFQAGTARLVSGPVSVIAYAWSPDGRKIAITGHGELGRLPSHIARHDLVLYRFDGDRLDVLEAGSGGDYLDDTVQYDRPFWSPDGTRIGYFRMDWRDRWDASAQVGIFSTIERRTILLVPDERLETYGARAFWLHPDTIFLENTHRAGRRLFAVAVKDGSVSPVVESDDWFDLHSFSRDGGRVAFVRERIDVPLDLHIADRAAMHQPRRLTNLHADLDSVTSTRVERVHWKGADAVDVEGWLYLPAGEAPFPTIVFIHGGPTWVFGNRYEPYVYAWPYALGVFAARGLAVFVPNYRGTGSYGKSFRRTSALDVEPISDVITGLDTLVARGIADPSRLGIMGHSHGCWLGPLIAVRHRRFRVAACAAGTGNRIADYERGAGWMNSEIVEYYWGAGASPYDEPERYRNVSPVYGFRGLTTPFLFEYGALTGAAGGGMEYATAAWRAGVPHEFVIYRDTGHNVTKPRIMLEVMNRNLDWFEFWLLGREDATGLKRAQYERWRILRELLSLGDGLSTRPPADPASGLPRLEVRNYR